MVVTPRINTKRIRAFADYAKTALIPPPFNFYSVEVRGGKEYVHRDMYPPLHADGVLDFFFFAMIHHYGLWLDDGSKYISPLFGKWNGEMGVKGSDLLWKILHATWSKDPEQFKPERLARIWDDEHAVLFSDDCGPIPLFNRPQRIALTRDYGKWFRARRMAGQSPQDLVNFASEYSDPVFVLREILTHPENGIPGYREDPLGEKAELLLMALVMRPDKLLRQGEGAALRPIVNCHVMRIALRMGLVTIPVLWRDENSARSIALPMREEMIRSAVKRSVEQVIELSGRTMAEIYNLMWSGRIFCLEATAPNCSECLLQSICARKTKLFQPVKRRTLY